ncbi:MAG: hypothetical protein NT107_00995 [Planctomycetota bacterium]|nr:hypothetical protein [Planctomycetota bacterium]
MFSDDSMTTDRRWIRARQILDFSASYDIAESLAKETVGTLRRRGFKPLVRDSWDVVDLQERVIANLLEGASAAHSCAGAVQFRAAAFAFQQQGRGGCNRRAAVQSVRLNTDI